jgi:tape measure domain-containing protein
MSAYEFRVGGDFQDLLRGFDQLDRRAQQSGQAIGKGIDEGVRGFSNRSLAALQQELARLERRQTRVAVDSTAFEKAGVRIREISQLIEGINRRRIILNADPNSVLALSSRLDELNGELNRVAIGGERFKQLQREIRGVEQALGRAAQAARAFRPNLGTAQGLSQELSRLQRIQSRTTSGEGVEVIQRRILEVQGQLDSLNRRRLLINADPSSVVALRSRLAELNNQIGEVAIGSRRFRELQREIRGVERELRKAGDAGGLAARGVGLVQGALGALGVAGVGLTVTQFFRSSIQQAIQLETATRRLTNTLGAQGAGAALGFVRGVSDELGLSFRDLVGSYGRFTAAATAANVPLDQQQELFKSVSRAGMALGLSNDEVNGAFLALQQIASKGTVSMEELRQQLGERLPIALSATARGLGLSTKELIKLVETGQLSANKFFPAFTKGLNELTEGSAGMPTAAQNLQRFTNAWEELQVSFGQNLLPLVTATVKQLTLAIDELKLQQEGVQLGLSSSIGSLGNDAAGLIGNLRNIRKEYSLGDEVYKKTFENAARLARLPQDPISGAFKIDGEGYERVLGIFEQLAIAYRRQNRDLKSEELQRAAAAQAITQRLEEQAQAQQKLNATSSQQEQINLLRTEAALTGRITDGKLAQVDADARLRQARTRGLREEISGLDDLIGKLEAARGSGANNQKEILTAQSARAQKVLEIAKLEAEGAKVEVERRQQALTLAQGRLQVAQAALDIEGRADQVATTRLRAQQQVLDAQLALQQAQQGLAESLFGVDRARQQFAIQGAEAELQRLQQRGAGADAIRRQEENIAGLKRGASDLDRRALEAQINAAAQRFELERKVLQLKQAQELLDAQSAQRAAAGAVLEARKGLLGLQGQALDPSLTASERANVQQQVQLQRQTLALAQQQQQAEAGRLQTLGAVFGLQNQALLAQQQTTANGFRAQAAAQGFEQSVSGSLNSLDESARATSNVAASVQQVSAGFVSAAGQTVQILTTVEEIGSASASAAQASADLATGYANANTNAQALLDTLQRIAATPQARWSGGPVEPGTAYRVNELGQEALLSGGRLSLINAPTRGLWRPPARGTVLPAGLTGRLKDAGAFDRPMAAGSIRTGNLEREIAALRMEISALRRKDMSLQVVMPSNAGLLRSVQGI